MRLREDGVERPILEYSSLPSPPRWLLPKWPWWRWLRAIVLWPLLMVTLFALLITMLAPLWQLFRP
jgi:hypothetical protein